MKKAAADFRGYTNVKGAARYTGMSSRTVRHWLEDGLRYSRLRSGRILISYEAIDEYLARFEVSRNQVDAMVNEMVEGL